MNVDVVGAELGPTRHTWTSKDCLLYAVGVGAGVEDLQFTTENSDGVSLQVLPTFPIVAAPADFIFDLLGEVDPAMIVHGEQGVEILGPIPIDGEVVSTTTITGIYDKRSGAAVASTVVSRSVETGEVLFRTTNTGFIRGAGGFGGDPGPGRPPALPERAPDASLTLPTSVDQALVYRLSGDRNPLHSDPVFARRAGFERPILHGLCTYGVTGRALVRLLCDNDAARLRSMWGRFSSPVYPGESLTIEVWSGSDGTAQFRTTGPDGRTVVDGGTVGFTGS